MGMESYEHFEYADVEGTADTNLTTACARRVRRMLEGAGEMIEIAIEMKNASDVVHEECTEGEAESLSRFHLTAP